MSDERALDRRELAPRPAEQLLIDALPRFPSERVLCAPIGRGQLAIAAARNFSTAAVTCHFLDLYHANLATQFVAAESSPDEQRRVFIDCSPDFPVAEFDLAVLPTSSQGAAELTREQLQTAHERLALGGTLLAATDNPRDRWLNDELQTIFKKVRRQDFPEGVVYVTHKEGPLRRPRNFAAEFAFRDRSRLFRVVSRPGVFSHRKIDPGARQLLNAMEILPGERVLDIGCGSGILALAAAARAEKVQVVAIDSHARAVECTTKNGALNELGNLRVEHSASGIDSSGGTFDRVLANPPYYAGFRIAEFFVDTALASLRQGGWLYVVTKHPDWYEETLPERFAEVRLHASKDYWVVQARK